MANLSSKTTAMKPKGKKGGKSPIKAKKSGIEKINADGGNTATVLKAKSELFLTAISTFAYEDSFYESGENRVDRVVELAHKVTNSDPEWMERFIPWLRGPEVNIRTMSVILAAEYVAAGGPNGRKVVDSVCQRADEPAEMLAYWMQQHYGWDNMTYPMPSPKIPAPMRKGLGDAVNRLYTEYAAMKYNGNSRGVGMGNVLNLIHPTPKDDEQNAIFQYIIDKAYGNAPELDKLPTIKANYALRDRAPLADKPVSTDELRAAGMTWEQLGGLLGGPWNAQAWEAVIPTMGYMAMLRNLRNFDAAGISKTTQEKVIAKLTDPDQVAKSRQLPFRFLSAYKNLQSDNYSKALGEALELSCKNIPKFEGTTLVLIDKSGSMSSPLSSWKDRRGFARRGRDYGDRYTRPLLWEVGAIFGMALAKAGEDVDVAFFGDTSKRIDVAKGGSILKMVQKLGPDHSCGHGTNIWGSVIKEYNGHDRVVIFTDTQDNHRRQQASIDRIPFLHYFDLGGYGMGAPFEMTGQGRYQYGGFSDSAFKMMALIEMQDANWPF